MQNKNDLTRNAPKGITGFLVRHKKPLISAISLAVALACWWIIWWIASKKINVSFIFPSPYEAVKELFVLLPQKEFTVAILGSLKRMFLGLLLGILIGTVGATLGYFFLPIKIFLAPLIKVTRSTPVASIILICVLFLRSNITPIFIALITVLPIVYENVLTGLTKTSAELSEAADAYGFSPFKKLILLYAPSALPYFGTACNVSLGLAWKSCISAEVLIVTAKSVGYYLHTSKLYFETERLFAWTIAIILISVLIEYAAMLISFLLKKYLGRRFRSYAK